MQALENLDFLLKQIFYIYNNFKWKIVNHERGGILMEEEEKLNVERKENAQRAAILLILFLVLTFLAVTLAILTSL